MQDTFAVVLFTDSRIYL